MLLNSFDGFNVFRNDNLLILHLTQLINMEHEEEISSYCLRSESIITPTESLL